MAIAVPAVKEEREDPAAKVATVVRVAKAVTEVRAATEATAARVSPANAATDPRLGAAVSRPLHYPRSYPFSENSEFSEHSENSEGAFPDWEERSPDRFKTFGTYSLKPQRFTAPEGLNIR